MWADSLGRTYEYTPHVPELLTGIEFEFTLSEVTLALAEASQALGSVPRFAKVGIEMVICRSESSASSLIEGVGRHSYRSSWSCEVAYHHPALKVRVPGPEVIFVMKLNRATTKR